MTELIVEDTRRLDVLAEAAIDSAVGIYLVVYPRGGCKLCIEDRPPIIANSLREALDAYAQRS